MGDAAWMGTLKIASVNGSVDLQMPDDVLGRQPFPGPGLAIRIIGEVTRERLEILREADAILQDEIREAGWYRKLWQSFAVLPAIRSVGVQGDERTYAYPIVLRAVTSDDAMTADWARLPRSSTCRPCSTRHRTATRDWRPPNVPPEVRLPSGGMKTFAGVYKGGNAPAALMPRVIQGARVGWALL